MSWLFGGFLYGNQDIQFVFIALEGLALFLLLLFLGINTCNWGFDKDSKKLLFWIDVCLILGFGIYAIVFNIIILIIVKIIQYFNNLRKAYKCFNNKENYWEYRASESVDFDFHTFKNLYLVSKKRFRQYGQPNNDFSTWQLFYSVESNEEIVYRILFPEFLEFCKFYFWYKKETKRCNKRKEFKSSIQKKKSYDIAMSLILKQAQKDIDALRKQSEEEIKQACDMMKDIGGEIEK